MDLLPGGDEETLVSEMRRYLEDRLPVTASAPGPVGRKQWLQWASLGWMGLGLGEAAGGSGQGCAQEALLFRELGRFLVNGPVLATVIAAHAAAAAGETALRDAFAAGEDRAAVAQPQRGGAFRMIDVTGADHAIVVGPESITVRAVDQASLSERAATDTSATVHRGTLGATVVSVPQPGQLYARALVLLSAQLVGISEETCRQSAAYARQREQFGRPIGAFQAVSHRCADMVTRAEVANMQTMLAALTIDEGGDDAEVQAHVALVAALDAANLNSADNIQNHGGIGFTTELSAQRFALRSQHLSNLLVTKREALDRILVPAN